MRSTVMVTCPNLTGKLRLFVEPTRAFKPNPRHFCAFGCELLWLSQSILSADKPAQIIARILGQGLVFNHRGKLRGPGGCIYGVLSSPAISDANRHEQLPASGPFGLLVSHRTTMTLQYSDAGISGVQLNTRAPEKGPRRTG
jgi:hypothetical protein